MLYEEDMLGIPSGTIPCWAVSESARLEALLKKTPFGGRYKPSCYFLVNERIDSSFIQGHLGQKGPNRKFHVEFEANIEYFRNYQNREPYYLSFDQISLYRIVNILGTKPLTFFLQRVDQPAYTEYNRAFMIMPFGYKKLNDLYTNHIRGYLKNESGLGITIYRSDDFTGNDFIVETILNQIEVAEIVIAETTYPNKNVFYELGVAVAKGKEVITMQDTDEDNNIFFDRTMSHS